MPHTLEVSRARSKPIYNIVTHYSIVLKARNRLLRINLFFNTHNNCRASGSAITHLPSFLQRKFGSTAVGILVGDRTYQNDEELMRDANIKSNESYYVLYEDYTPSYGECISEPPVYNDGRDPNGHRTLPAYNDAEVRGYLKPLYFNELVYYPTIPHVVKTIQVKLSFGRRATITLDNKNIEHADNFRHELYMKAGYKAQGIVTPDGKIYTTDEILWKDDVEEGEVYKIVKDDTGYSLTMASERQTMPPRTVSAGLRRIGSNTNRSIHRVTSRSSTSSRETVHQPIVRVK